MSSVITNQEFVQSDARNRALRTFLQGLAVDVLATLVLVLLPIVSSASSFADFQWEIIVFLVVKTAVVTAFSYLMRTVLDKSAIPTPEPPSYPGNPSTPAAEPILEDRRDDEDSLS